MPKKPFVISPETQSIMLSVMDISNEEFELYLETVFSQTKSIFYGNTFKILLLILSRRKDF